VKKQMMVMLVKKVMSDLVLPFGRTPSHHSYLRQESPFFMVPLLKKWME
jgi:hypothetical protein